MPKKDESDKKTGAQKRTTSFRGRRSPLSINELLAKKPLLRRIAAEAPIQQAWLDWLREQIPSDCGSHVVSVIAKGGELVVFADSPGWSARLRYVMAPLQAQITARDAATTRMRVRVLRAASMD